MRRHPAPSVLFLTTVSAAALVYGCSVQPPVPGADEAGEGGPVAGDPGGEGTEGEGDGGAAGRDVGEGTEGEGEPPVEGEGEGAVEGEGEGDVGPCAEGDVEECAAACIVGERRCEDGAFGPCGGQIACEDPACHERLPGACGERPCEEGTRRECRDGCMVGLQGCREGQWSDCALARVDCRDPGCAERHPECAEGECAPGELRRCREGCEVGGQVCLPEGGWSPCRLVDVACDDPECAEGAEVCRNRECPPAAVEECEGDCFVGLRACVDGAWSECAPRRFVCEKAECRERIRECQEPPCEDAAMRRCESRCVVGEQTCADGQWGACVGDVNCNAVECAEAHPRACAPPACEPGAERRCQEGCIVGGQVCLEGRWSLCHGRVNCDDERCAAGHPDACAPPECEDGAAEECGDDCFRGVRVCREGRFGDCHPVEVQCADEQCAERFPRACDRAECEERTERRCEAGCIAGAQMCVEGRWGECRGPINCDLDECARRHPDACGGGEQCEAGAERRCEAGCIVGAQRCLDGRWTDCRGRVNCGRGECAREHPEICGEPECEDGTARRCETECVVGQATCVEGRWSECRGEVDCGIDVCADRFADACGQPPADCDPGTRQGCRDECAEGHRVCTDQGAWGACQFSVARCEIRECAARHPALCQPPPACEGDATRDCQSDDGCAGGRQACVDGQWGRCVLGDIRCDLADCAERHPDACPRPDPNACEPRTRRDCSTEDRCISAGVQMCTAARVWGPCEGPVNCQMRGCPERYPRACAR